MVRPTSAVWNHFISEYRRGGKKKEVKCRYCQKKYLVPNATKMAKHLEKCLKKPIVVSVPVYSNVEDSDEIPVIIGSQEMLTDVESMHIDPGMSGSFTNSSLPTADVAYTSGCSQEIESSTSRPIYSFFDSMSSMESEKLDAALAKAIYSSNLPLSLTDNSYWQNFFKQIRPSYRVPSRHDLTNKLLDKEYHDVNQSVKEQIRKADFVTIITDGWSNIRNEGIVSYIVTTPTPLFFKSVETKENRHTADYIALELISVINEIGSAKVIALVTDNANNMKAAWRIVQEQYAHILTIGCAAHGLNLLLSDISKIGTFHMIITKAKDVVKYVKSKQTLLSTFTSKQKLKRGSAATALKLPAETRWCSTLLMFQSLLNGKESLQETVLVDDLNIDKEIRQLVLDNDIFWASVHSLVNVLSPICNGIAKIESDSATLSDVPHVFFCVKRSLASLVSTPLQVDEEEEVKTIVETRRLMFCQPVHYAAYLLDPRYVEDELAANDFKSAVDFISSFLSTEPAANILADFAQFKSRQSIYDNDSVWESAKLLTPLVWWKGFFKCQSLSSIAMQIFNVPPSSAACERIFSAFSKTHSSVRNRLSNIRVSKLVAIRSNLILQSKQHVTSFDDDDSESD